MAHVTRVDAVLGQCLGTVWIVGQQLVAVVMEIADQRHVAAHLAQPVAYRCDHACGLRRFHRDAHQLRAGTRQLRHLDGRGDFILGVGVGHGLHHNRRTAAYSDRTDAYPYAVAPP